MEENNELVNEQQKRERLNNTYLYLDSLSSFHQMYSGEYLDDVRKVGVTLRAKCNAGEVFSNE